MDEDYEAFDEIADAIRAGDDERALRLLANRPDLAREIDLLVDAARCGRIAVVGHLLAAGAPPNSCDEAGFTPTLVAARAGHIGIVRMLSEAGAGTPGIAPEAIIRKVIAEDRFYEAISAGDLDEMRHLLDEFPGFAQLYEALWLATDGGDAGAVLLLLDSGASPGPGGGEPNNDPLVVAAGMGHIEIMRMLVEAGATNLGGALRAASSSGQEAATSWLLDAGTPVDARSESGTTALWWAAHYGAEGVVRLLLAHGADARDDLQYGPPLFQAIQSGDLGSVVALLQFGADPRSTVPETGLTALEYAAYCNREDIRAAIQRAIDAHG